MEGATTYHQLLAEIITVNLSKLLQTAEPGHCLRLEGLPHNVLDDVCRSLQSEANGAKIVLLSNNPKESYQVSATKLIELRNSAEKSHPLLVLIPSNLRTAAEDSFDRATFKQLEVGSFPAMVVKRLQDELPDTLGKVFLRIKGFLDTTLTRVPFSDWASYLLACRQNSYSLESWGKCLHHVGLIPDSLLAKNLDILEQRLHQNSMAVDCLTDEKQPLISRIAALQIEGNNIQKPLFDLLSSQALAEDVRGWGRMIAEDAEWHQLDLENWKFLDLRPPQELELFVHPLKGKQIVPRQPGDTNKRIVTKENRDAKVTIGFLNKTWTDGSQQPHAFSHPDHENWRSRGNRICQYTAEVQEISRKDRFTQ